MANILWKLTIHVLYDPLVDLSWWGIKSEGNYLQIDVGFIYTRLEEKAAIVKEYYFAAADK